MERLEVIKIARDVFHEHHPVWWEVEPEEWERFAALVAADERERIVKLCEQFAVEAEDYQPHKGYGESYFNLAAAIRALT